MKTICRWLHARYLSRKGEHAAALYFSDFKDVHVLSNAGMHLTTLEHAGGASVAHALALSQVGRTDAALDMSRAVLSQSGVKSLLGGLATQAPRQVLEIIATRHGWSDLRAFCGCALGLPEAELLRARLSPLHAMNLALWLGEIDMAARSFKKCFENVGLVAPQNDWCERGIDIESLTCETDHFQNGPLVSVIVTAYNEELLLPISVRSILNQAWESLELIIVDDGSTDGTYKTACALAGADKRIRVIHLDQNVGTWRAKNIGMRASKGEFITMHDADDWSHPAKLSTQVLPLLHSDRLKCSSSYFFRVNCQSGRLYTRNGNSFLRWNPSSLLFRRDVVEKIGRFRDGLLGSDCEFAARIELMWGVSSHERIRKPLSIGLQRRGSLSDRYRLKNDGERRLANWEQWRRDHVAIFAEKLNKSQS